MSSARSAGLPHVEDETPAVLVLRGPLAREAVAQLCAEVRGLLEGRGGGVVVVDVGALGPPGLAAVELLARLELTARRAGGRIRLRDPDAALAALLELTGLRFQTEREAEQREPSLGVEEAVESGDPAG
ncbi:STAS domain-containing protein [Streptomyces sp. NPDC001606]